MLHRRIIRVVFVLAVFVGLFGFAGNTAAEENSAGSGRRIVVNLAQQRLYAYQGNTLVMSMAVNARGTRRGNFVVQNRITVAGSIYRGWLLPYWLGIYYVGRVQNGIHGPEMIGKRTATTSLGCVVILSSANAAALFRWAPVGIPVTVR
jgi:lipoprotein-anchoring transpeptidase ErfK/SrfK